MPEFRHLQVQLRPRLLVEVPYLFLSKDMFFQSSLIRIQYFLMRNFDIQYSTYKIGAQPYYVLLDNEEKLLTQPRSYTADIPTYVQFLDEGVKAFKSRQSQISVR